MGYSVYASLSDVRIPAREVPGALKALVTLAKKKPEYAWTRSKGLSKSLSLIEAIMSWRYSASEEPVPDVEQLANQDVSGGVLIDSFDGEKWGDDSILWDTLSPYIEAGAVIEYTGEDNARWRYMFDGESAEEEHANILWTRERNKLKVLRENLESEGLRDHVTLLNEVLSQV